MASGSVDKKELRVRMRGMRQRLSAPEQEAAARAVLERIMGYAPYRQAATVMAYMAVRGELSLERVIRDALESGKRLALPRCESPGVMTARWVRSLDDLEPGAYGLPEPKVSCETINPKEIDLIFVPGAAFDRTGHRLGQGGGYYDRFLSGSAARRAGICHEFALLESVPFEKHDEIMDDIITPGGIYHAGEKCDRRT